MRGREQRRPYPGEVGQLPGAGAVRVERERDGTDACRRQDRAVEREAVGLHRQRAAQNPATEEQAQRVRDTGTHHDPVRGGADTPRPRQVPGQCPAQLRAAPRVARPERLVRRGGQGAARGRQPRGAREGGGIRLPLPQVVHGRGRTRGRLPRDAGDPGGLGARRHPRTGALPGDQPSLGHQLGVRGGDGVAGQAEVGGEGPVRRQEGAGGQSPVPDGVAQRADERGPAAAGAGQFQMQVAAEPSRRIGPRIRHANAP